ncbi:hypothetical protein ISS37_08225 [candidate division KSB1 bacterium]|nr:hypothetical protein [candidate division KSB1 bacterium]
MGFPPLKFDYLPMGDQPIPDRKIPCIDVLGTGFAYGNERAIITRWLYASEASPPWERSLLP